MSNFGDIPANIEILDGDTRQVFLYLMQIIEFLSAQSAVDPFNRQRITLDSITGGLTLAAVTTVSSVTNIAAIAGQGNRMFEDFARISYSNGIRNNLKFG